MKAIKCEMCNSSDVVKQDGFFVCQSCGTKYSVEEAKKLMVEGTVKIDTSDELANLYEIARRAKEDNNTENAHKYYDMILAKDPSSWEANFYTVYYQAMNCKIAEIQTAAIRVDNCLKNVFKLIKETETDETKQEAIITELSIRLILIAKLLASSADNHYKGIGESIRGQYTTERNNRCLAAIGILDTFGDLVKSNYGDKLAKTYSLTAWRTCVEIYKHNIGVFTKEDVSNQRIYRRKIAKYDSNEKDALLAEYDKYINETVTVQKRFKPTCITYFGLILTAATLPSGLGLPFTLIFAALTFVTLLIPYPTKAVIEKNVVFKNKIIKEREDFLKQFN